MVRPDIPVINIDVEKPPPMAEQPKRQPGGAGIGGGRGPPRGGAEGGGPRPNPRTSNNFPGVDRGDHRGGGGGGRGGARDGQWKRRSDNEGGDRFSSQRRSDRHGDDPYARLLPGGGDVPAAPMVLEEMPKKKFTGRCRLFIGNLPHDVKEEQIRELVKPHGEISECFSSGKGFAFVRLETRAHAEAAKDALDGHELNGRPIRVRFAVHGAAVRIKELSPYVSNELLHQAFSMFGEVERAVHVVDEKGRPTGEGIVEFERKPAAQEAMRRTGEGVFLLTASLKPITIEPLEPKDEDDGLSERMVPRSSILQRERQQEPRFVRPGTFEFEFGNRWKALYQVEKMRRETLEKELKEARQELENDMDLAYQDYQAQMIREDLHRRQEELERLEAARRERIELNRRRDEERARMRQAAAPPFSQGYGMYQGSYGHAPPEQRQGQGGFQQYGSGSGGERHQTPGPGDENLVHGVEKLLQMFKGGPGDTAGQTPAGQGQNYGGNNYDGDQAAMQQQQQQQPQMQQQEGDNQQYFSGVGMPNMQGAAFNGPPPGLMEQVVGQPQEFQDFGPSKRRRF